MPRVFCLGCKTALIVKPVTTGGVSHTGHGLSSDQREVESDGGGLHQQATSRYKGHDNSQKALGIFCHACRTQQKKEHFDAYFSGLFC
jgi:hypothetical protein